MILQVVVSGFLREPFREDLGIFIIWDDPPSAVGLFQALTSRVEKLETNFQVGAARTNTSSRDRARTGWFGTFSSAGGSFQNGGGLVRESPKTLLRSGLGSIVICPE